MTYPDSNSRLLDPRLSAAEGHLVTLLFAGRPVTIREVDVGVGLVHHCG